MPVPPGDIDKLFPDVVPDNPDPHTFELGLVLGGTVSAGAYTAGALDFLLEALEAWHDKPTPPHRVVIQTAAGSSGGAVCAAILGLLSSRKVPHPQADATPGADPPVPTGNPLWDLWVNEFQINRLLSTGDIDANQNADDGTGATVARVQHVAALLNCQMIDDAGQKLAAIGGQPGEVLPYFSAPFRIAVTVANLRGIPYKILDIPKFGQFSGAAYVQHDDFAWFAFPNGASPVATATSAGKRPDEFWLDPVGRGSGIVGYDTLVAFATASGAMPVGLAARALSRPAEHYRYRPMVRPVISNDGTKEYRVDWPQPDWTGLPDAEQGTYAFTAVDGGTFNNDPVTLVHQSLAGLIGRNPKGKSDAKRAIFMVDPLSDEPKPIARVGKSFLAVVGNIIGSVVSAARYLTADMELFANEDVFSRFQLVPFRPEPGRVGEAALAGTSLYAAGGWCARAFRVHDFLLGRQNMQAYLRQELVLAGDNPLFGGWDMGRRNDFAMDANGTRISVTNTTPASSYFLPVIPQDPADIGGPIAAPDWPNGAFDPAALEQPLAHRLRAVIDKLVEDNTMGALPWIIRMFAVPGVVDVVAKKVTEEFATELEKAGLWPRKPATAA